MNIKLKNKYRRQRHSSLSAFFRRNPVLALALDLPFVIVCATTLKTAVALSFEMMLIHMVTIVCAMVTVRTLPTWLRPIVNIGVSFIVMTLARYWITLVFPDLSNYVRMYIYLMAVNGVTVYQCSQITRRTKPLRVLAGGFANVIMFALSMVVVSLVREYLSAGTLWGAALPVPIRFAGLAMPFGGFILMGFFLAFARLINRLMLSFAINESIRMDARYTEITQPAPSRAPTPEPGPENFSGEDRT